MSLWRSANHDFYSSGVWQTLYDEKGRRILKYPTDLWVYEEIIRRTKPAVIVETGSYQGGSATWFSRFAPVVSVDIVAPLRREPGITWIAGDSVEMVDKVANVVAGRSCLVTLDSDHNAEHVLAELEVYSPLASEYLVVEDTAVDAYGIDADVYPRGGPGRAVQTFLEASSAWKPDPECDRFMLGMNPGGWLRRVG